MTALVLLSHKSPFHKAKRLTLLSRSSSLREEYRSLERLLSLSLSSLLLESVSVPSVQCPYSAVCQLHYSSSPATASLPVPQLTSFSVTVSISVAVVFGNDWVVDPHLSVVFHVVLLWYIVDGESSIAKPCVSL